MLFLLLLACYGCAPKSNERVVRLPSGRHIVVIGQLGAVRLGDGTNLFTMSYRTHKKVTDPALRSEIDEVWALFRSDVERAKFKAAAINAMELPDASAKSFFFSIEKSNSRNFVFTQLADETWQWIGDQKKQ